MWGAEAGRRDCIADRGQTTGGGNVRRGTTRALFGAGLWKAARDGGHTQKAVNAGGRNERRTGRHGAGGRCANEVGLMAGGGRWVADERQMSGR